MMDWLHNLQITTTTTSPEVAFTGDTMADFIIDPTNVDVLRAKILVMEVFPTPMSTIMFLFVNFI